MKLLNSVIQNYDHFSQKKLYPLTEQKAPKNSKKMQNLLRSFKEASKKPQRNRKETAKNCKDRKEIIKKLQRNCKGSSKKPQ